MPQIVVTKDALIQIKEYIADIQDLDIGEFTEFALLYTFEHIEDFEAWMEKEGYFEFQEEGSSAEEISEPEEPEEEE